MMPASIATPNTCRNSPIVLLYRVGDAILRNLRAIPFRDPSNFPIRQLRPAFEQSREYLSPIMPRPRFDRHVIGLILLMNFECLGKNHFGRDFAVAITDPLAMLFEKFRELGFSPRRFTYEDGPVAQRLEQGTHNPLVPGSNPGGPSPMNAIISRGLPPSVA